jgi:hypothetical protein
MAERTCFNCMYCICDPCLWRRSVWAGESIVPQCANHPQWPGQLHDVPGIPCRNYRPKLAAPQGDNVRMIATIDGGYAYVDAADYEWLNQWKWHLENGYAARRGRGKRIFMHRLILPPPRGKMTDHSDGNRANNCRCNLRVCDRSENSHNCRKSGGGSSIYKGVSYDRKTHKWCARCFYRGRRIPLGFFESDIEAARAYDRKAVELFGEFARLNFPREWPPERRAQVHARSEYRLQAGKTSPTRTPSRATGRSKKAKARREKGKSETEKAKVKRRKEKSRKTTARAEPAPSAAKRGTRGRSGRKRPTKSARARAAKSGRKGKM